MDGVSRDHKRDKNFKSKEKSEVESWRGNQFRKRVHALWRNQCNHGLSIFSHRVSCISSAVCETIFEKCAFLQTASKWKCPFQNLL